MWTHLPKHPKLTDLGTRNKNGNRLYLTPSGKLYPSVTTVLKLHSKDGIADWRKRVGAEEANKVAARAAGRGTRMHSLVEHTLLNETVTPGLMDREMYLSLQPYLRKIDNIWCMEQALYSDHLRMAGRTDCVGEYDGTLSIIDYKTSTKLKKAEWITAYFMQTAGYAVMFEERTGIPVAQGVVIIGVDFEAPQVYIVRRDAWIKKLIAYRNQWEQRYL